jgi:hypothetical protein
MDGYLPYLIILLCPLMHIMMMRGMHRGWEKERNDFASYYN